LILPALCGYPVYRDHQTFPIVSDLICKGSVYGFSVNQGVQDPEDSMSAEEAESIQPGARMMAKRTSGPLSSQACMNGNSCIDDFYCDIEVEIRRVSAVNYVVDGVSDSINHQRE
jgi:hypothetical protein